MNIRIRIFRKDFLKLSKNSCEKLRQLTLDEPSSGMNVALDERLSPTFLLYWRNSQAFIVKDIKTGKWIAWCLARVDIFHKTNVYMMFVDFDYRRMGIGKKLFKKAVSHFDNGYQHYCCPWDYGSNKFYKHLAESMTIYSAYTYQKM